ncbi:MAG: hypothetical protein NVSMB44_13960 [Ktedonobacteraceae bacterium]
MVAIYILRVPCRLWSKVLDSYGGITNNLKDYDGDNEETGTHCVAGGADQARAAAH